MPIDRAPAGLDCAPREIDWDFLLDLAVYILWWLFIIFVSFKLMDEAAEWLRELEDQF